MLRTAYGKSAAIGTDDERANYPPVNTHLIRSRGFVATLGLMTATAVLTLDLSLPAIPAMVEVLSTNLSRGQQIVGVFMLGMSLGQIPAGLAADRFGRLPALYGGMGLFALAATVAALATEIHLLLLARFVQGIGAASAIVISRAIVRDIASGKEAAHLLSLMTMISTAAPVIAPSIGALLVAQWGWRAPFIVIAVCAFGLIASIRINLVETHIPIASERPVRQLMSSFREYFSHRQSVFGLLILVLPPAGYMSIIAVSAALMVDIYGYSITQYGYIFACAGLSVLLGSAANRWLVMRYDTLALIRLGVIIIFAAGLQLAIIAWLDTAPLWWVWSCVCEFMVSIAILFANTTVLALDPLKKIAGFASAIIGMTQNVIGASGALLGAFIYDGTVRNTVIIMAIVGIATAGAYLLRPLIAPGVLMQHNDELARN